MNRHLILVTSATLAMLSVSLHAQTPSAQTPYAQTPVVEVELGPAVQARQRDLGASGLAEQRQYLQKEVQRALAARGAGLVQASLTIQDIEPNLPTAAQLGRSPGLRAGSPGLGGAAVTGEVVAADGQRLPVRFRWFQNQPRDEVNFTTWGDADEAFDRLADALRAGRTPDDASSWPPPHEPRIVTGTLIP